MWFYQLFAALIEPLLVVLVVTVTTEHQDGERVETSDDTVLCKCG